MMDNFKNQKIRIIEMAKKRRQIQLIEKLQSGRSSTPALKKGEIRELEELSSESESRGYAESQESVARAFGVSVRTVARWLKEGMPPAQDGKYDLEKINSWRAEHEGKVSGGRKGVYADKVRWEIARLKEDVKKRRIENDVRKGKLILRDKVEKELINISLAMKRALLVLPNTISLRCFGQEPRKIKAIVQEEVENVIDRISESKIFDKKKEKEKSG